MPLDESILELVLRGVFTALRFIAEVTVRCIGESIVGAIFGYMGSWTLWLGSLCSIDREIDDNLCIAVGFIEFILLATALSFW